eukprot:COSAG02_NODE_58_length_43613_cov_235.901572_18_plen_87_part_00
MLSTETKTAKACPTNSFSEIFAKNVENEAMMTCEYAHRNMQQPFVACHRLLATNTDNQCEHFQMVYQYSIYKSRSVASRTDTEYGQ